MRWNFLLLGCLFGLLAAVGCSRTHYRLRADHEAYAVLSEKAAATPWNVPAGFTVSPDQRSRFYDPTPSDDPTLPMPAPRLYAYDLPELPPRDPHRFQSERAEASDESGSADERLSVSDLPEPAADELVITVSYLHQPPPNADGTHAAESAVVDTEEQDALAETQGGMTILPIPVKVWEDLPQSCLIRMFEFEYVRGEYEMTYGRQPGPKLRDASQRLALEDIVDLAVINSRDYQLQKERLYRAALGLTLDRFDYDLKFSTSGNRTSANYLHDRDRGDTVSSLGIPTLLTGDRLLATGGDLLARFANDVVLTFGGSSGFDANVGSELLFELTQSLLQRDIVLEGLTRAEREVVYAARDFARYRKTLFSGLADQYYRLLLAYRAVEIDTLDYFSNTRGFEQGAKEFKYANVPRFQVDQFEQQSLESRRRLIGTCNALEGQLDRLKIQVGIPPEMPVNLDLTELNILTMRDEATAAIESVRRTWDDLKDECDEESPSRSALINAAVNMTNDALNYLQVRERLMGEPQDTRELDTLLCELKLEESRLNVESSQAELAAAAQGAQPMKQTVLRRTLDLTASLTNLLQWQLNLAQQLELAADQIAVLTQDHDRLTEAHKRKTIELSKMDPRSLLQEEDQLCQAADALLAEAQAAVDASDRLLQTPQLTEEEQTQQTIAKAQRLLADGLRFIEEESVGLTPLEVDLDDAMLTALTCRFDLMNQREELADAWRYIKLTGDDLKSILNLRVTHQLRTDPDFNRPFDFGVDDSTTRVAMSFDAPLNRKAQRNAYRRSLIDYNAGLRALIAAEDNIKLDVRDLLRSMQLNKEQYDIAVKSTALAYSRLASTKLQLQEGIKNVTARDVLESQQAYTSSLTRLASAHISYIQNRISLFLDLEQLQVDADGFWPELYNEGFQFEPVYYLETYGRPVYGELPGGVLPSHKLKRMLHVPPGETVIFEPQANASSAGGSEVEAPPAPLPPPP